jgi:hypothetical protein
MKINEYSLPVSVLGHAKIIDDLGQVHVDETNAVHPQNLSRIISRALAHENNSYVYRMAFGNGGTIINAAGQIAYKTPNDGQAPDTAGWRSQLYNETYSEVVDEISLLDGTGPGSDPTNDPSKNSVVSQDNGLTSSVVITCTLNPFEPSGQTITDQLPPSENPQDAFVFDEIGLFTSGSSLINTAGYQDINVGTKFDTSVTGLTQNTVYTFSITVDSGTKQVITFNTGTGSGVGGELLYSDLIEILNVPGTMSGCIAQISNTSGTVNTYGALRFVSNSVGSTSTVVVDTVNPPPNWMFNSLVGYLAVETAVTGQGAGLQNNTTDSNLEGERLLTHLIFSPVRKSQNRTLTIIYTLIIQVARSTA